MDKEIRVVNLNEKFDSFSDHWNPRVIGELNGQMVKIARFKDEFVMHQHEHEDEMFFVVEGKLIMEMEDQTLEVNEGEFLIVPRGTNHLPKAEGEAKIMMFEPASTLNTGNVVNDKTVSNLKRL